MPKRFSTVRGREFGEGLRAAIAGTGLSARQFADDMGWHESKVSDAVTGKGGVTEIEVATMLGRCGVSSAECERLLQLFPVIQKEDWWQQHGTCAPVRSATGIGLVKNAESLISWQPHVVPSFLRTDDYANRLLIDSATVPEVELDVRSWVQSDLRCLLANGFSCTFYIHEFALHLQVGTTEVQAEQMHDLMLMANKKNITIRIVPVVAGVHAGMAGPFTHLKFEHYNPVVWLEPENSSLFIERSDLVEGYEAVVRELDKRSLGEEESLELIVSRRSALQDPHPGVQQFWSAERRIGDWN